MDIEGTFGWIDLARLALLFGSWWFWFKVGRTWREVEYCWTRTRGTDRHEVG